jgi:glycerophosphoryl diester phosphodiesterase
VLAHRGASAHAPENTLAAVRLARMDGATGIEGDVHRTRDGVLVVHHDPTLARTTDGATSLPGRAPWRIADLTWAEVSTVDAGVRTGPVWVGERVPTLADWCAAVGPDLRMLVEVKAPAGQPGLARDVAEVLAASPAARDALAGGRLLVQSFDHRWLRRLKEEAPALPVGLLTERRPGAVDLRSAAGWAEQVNPGSRWLTRGDVARAHDLGLGVDVWTVDDPARMLRLVRWGVDGIITNRPARLVGLLGAAAA